jgi:hypothetical protein
MSSCGKAREVSRALGYEASSCLVSASQARTSDGTRASVGSCGTAPSRVEAWAEMAQKSMGLTEPLCAMPRLAVAKRLEPSFEMLVIALDVLLLGFSCDVVGFWMYLRQSRRVRDRFICRHRARGHPRVLESGVEESTSGCGVAVLLEQHLDDLAILIDRDEPMAAGMGGMDAGA